jgi:hypothetical protein
MKDLVAMVSSFLLISTHESGHVACYFGKVWLMFWDKKEVFQVLFYVFIVLTRYVFVYIFVLFIFFYLKIIIKCYP